MAKVASPMPTIVRVSVRFGPILSPKWPQNSPPIGRTRNESAKTPKVCISAMPGSVLGKNTWAMVVARYA